MALADLWESALDSSDQVPHAVNQPLRQFDAWALQIAFQGFSGNV